LVNLLPFLHRLALLALPALLRVLLVMLAHLDSAQTTLIGEILLQMA